MITNIIVGASAVFTVMFVVAWFLRPNLRSWIERPKYHFQDAVQGYDRAHRPEGDNKGSHSS